MMRVIRMFQWIGTGSLLLSMGFLSFLGAQALFDEGADAGRCLMIPEKGIVAMDGILGRQAFAYGISEDGLHVAVDRQVFTTEIRDGKFVDLVFRPVAPLNR